MTASVLIEEQGTTHYASLSMAQAAALPVLALAIARAVRAGLEGGRFAVSGRRIVLNGGSHGQASLPVAAGLPGVGLCPR